MPKSSRPKPTRPTRCELDEKQLIKDGESPNPIWQSFPADLFDSLFAQCDQEVLGNCRLLSKGLSNVAARHLFRIVPCCTFGRQHLESDGKLDLRGDIPPHIFKFVRAFQCQLFSGEDCLAEWESGEYPQVTKFILQEVSADIDANREIILVKNYAEIQKCPNEEHRYAYMTGEFPVENLAKVLDTVYLGRAPQLVWKQLEAPDLLHSRHVSERPDHQSRPRYLLQRSVFEWMITGYATYRYKGIDQLLETPLERLVMPTDIVTQMMWLIPDCNYLRLVNREDGGHTPSEYEFGSEWWFPDDSRYRYWDEELDEKRITNLQWQLSYPHTIQEVDIHEWEHPVWWPLLTWNVQEGPHMDEVPMLRQACTTLHIFVSLKYLEKAAECWRSELYRDDMGPDGSGTLKHLYLYLGDVDYHLFKKSEKPFDPSLLLEWLQRVIPKGCRVHFRGKDLGQIAERYRLQTQEAFDRAFPRGWHHVVPSQTVIDDHGQ